MNEGYVLAPRHEGGRYLVVILAGRQHVVDFGFSVPLPDGDFDFEQLAPAQIYAGFDRPDLDLSELRQRQRELPCCAADEEGNAAGDPLNLVVAGLLNVGCTPPDNAADRKTVAEAPKTQVKIAELRLLASYGISHDLFVGHDQYPADALAAVAPV